MKKTAIFLLIGAFLVLTACAVAGCVSDSTSQNTDVQSPTAQPTQSYTNSVLGGAWSWVMNGTTMGEYLVFNEDGTYEDTIIRPDTGKVWSKSTHHWDKWEGHYFQTIGDDAVGVFTISSDGSSMTMYTKENGNEYTYVRVSLSDVPN